MEKIKRKKSPTQRALAELREQGYRTQVVEHWNPYARIRQDLFQMIDIVGLNGKELLGIQATTLSNLWARVEKILGNPLCEWWCRSGNRLEVWAYRKLKDGKYHRDGGEFLFQDGKVIFQRQKDLPEA